MSDSQDQLQHFRKYAETQQGPAATGGQAWADLSQALREMATSCLHAAGAAERLARSREACRPPAAPEQPPCTTCPKREQGCRESCDLLEAFLPGECAGRGRHENLTAFDGNLAAAPRPSYRPVYEQFSPYFGELTEKQAQAVNLHLGRGFSLPEAATELGISTAAVRNRLSRAWARLRRAQVRLFSEIRPDM
jgi:hypothetical protein